MSRRYERLFFPFLSKIEPEVAHARTLQALDRAQRVAPGRALLRRIAGEIPRRPLELWGLTFPNVLGVAAGYDKDVRVAQGLSLLGFGHVEVGTITPWRQEGNAHPRLFRLPADKALVNRLGFPNGGMVAASQRLRQLAAEKRDFILGVSLGKQKETRLLEAATDYVTVMRAVYRYADYLVINISSPNTPGLRRLQTRHYLSNLLGQLAAENHNLGYLHKSSQKPLLVKVSPDLTVGELDEIVRVVIDHRLDGIVATNTTTAREALRDGNRREKGGLSGAPLADRSTEIVQHICRTTGGKLPVIGVGGVFSAGDVRAKLDAGAVLVQLYTGLVYEGPGLAGRLLRAMVAPVA